MMWIAYFALAALGEELPHSILEKQNHLLRHMWWSTPDFDVQRRAIFVTLEHQLFSATTVEAPAVGRGEKTEAGIVLSDYIANVIREERSITHEFGGATDAHRRLLNEASSQRQQRYVYVVKRSVGVVTSRFCEEVLESVVGVTEAAGGGPSKRSLEDEVRAFFQIAVRSRSSDLENNKQVYEETSSHATASMFLAESFSLQLHTSL